MGEKKQASKQASKHRLDRKFVPLRSTTLGRQHQAQKRSWLEDFRGNGSSAPFVAHRIGAGGKKKM